MQVKVKALVLALVAVAALGGRAEASWPGLNGEMVVVGKLAGQSSTDLFRVAGTNSLINVTNSAASETQPSISPDGTKAVYVLSTSNRYACGSNKTMHCWRTLVDIYLWDFVASTSTRLTSDLAVERDPSWSNDGTRVLFSRHLDGDYEIFSMKTDGTDLRQLTNNTVDDRHAVWGPYLQGWCNVAGYPACAPEIAFVREVPSVCTQTYCTIAHTDIWLMETDGTNQRRLTTSVAYDTEPNWSPVGMDYYNAVSSTSPAKLTFASNRGGDVEIFTMSTAGESSVSAMTNNTYDDTSPQFAPQGNKIVYSSMYTGTPTIWTLNPRDDYEGIDHQHTFVAYTDGGQLTDPDWASYQHP